MIGRNGKDKSGMTPRKAEILTLSLSHTRSMKTAVEMYFGRRFHFPGEIGHFLKFSLNPCFFFLTVNKLRGTLQKCPSGRAPVSIHPFTVFFFSVVPSVVQWIQQSSLRLVTKSSLSLYKEGKSLMM